MRVSDSDILLAIKKEGPATTASLRARLGLTHQGARQRLAQLAEAGLLREERRQVGIGRPSALWSLTADGHARFPDGHAELSAALLDDVRQVFGAEGLERLIGRREAAQAERYRQALAGAGDLRERLERLAALRSAEGYMAELQAEPDGSWLLIEHHCPICAAATACQGFCRSELALFAALLAPDGTVDRQQHLLAGDRRCVYRIRPRR